jgi:polysaccharide biosynthesis/export protein VpsN
MKAVRIWCAAFALIFGSFSAFALKPVDPQLPVLERQADEVNPATRKPQLTAQNLSVTGANYVLAVGDSVFIEVFGEPELSREYTVGEGGSISFPLIGEIEIAGNRPKQVEKRIATALKKGYLVNPRVSVVMRSYRAVYVNGQVRQPGGFPYVPGMTVRKVVTLAGGFTERASKSRIYVISENAGENAKPRKIKLDAEVKPGDIVSIEESFF